jgi:hypothetical protein
MKKNNAAENFLKALEIGGMTHFQAEDRCRILHLPDENSISAAREIFQGVTSEYPEDDWIVNITGGTKPMSIAAYDFFRDRDNATIYYVSLKNQEALNFSGGIPLKLDHKVTIREFLAGYGFSLTDESDIKEGEARAEQWFDASVYLVANYNNPMVKDFLKKISTISRDTKRNGRKKGLDIQDSDGLNLEDRVLLEYLLKIFPSIKVNGNSIVGKLTVHEVCFLTGGWLEVFVWFLLFRHSDKLGIWDVHLGLEVGKKDSSTTKTKSPNELDVAFMQDQSLYSIECKTGEQKHDKNGDNALYKVEAIKKNFGAIKVKSCLATTSENVIDKKTGKIKEQLATRADIYKCNIVLREQLQKIAKKYLENPNRSDLIELIASEFKLKPEARS